MKVKSHTWAGEGDLPDPNNTPDLPTQRQLDGEDDDEEVVGERDRDLDGLREAATYGQPGYLPKQVTVLLNEDGQEVKEVTRNGRRPLLPVGIWAKLESIKVKEAIRVGTENEKTWFHSKEHLMLLLTNRTIKIKSRAKPENHCYVPLENVNSFQVEKDAAFERRFEKGGNSGPS